ncbi:MAG: mechanosensitive ion channel family protein [Clostridia bacterium]|nr:mechanosensitive ion channel family protein [Clostridia bacterium]
MKNFTSKLVESLGSLATKVGGKIVLALLVLIVGCIVIRTVKRMLGKADKFTKLDKTVQSFVKNLISILLYAILIITVISILGIPMTSVAAILASCGLAVGLSLQGALSNFAGGIMLLIFKPFRVGDYIAASGAEGVVREITVFYTIIVTVDNKRITVPNGDLMNANVTNFSCEESRRIDLDFKITNDCDSNLAKGVLLKAAEQTKGVKNEPAPFARLTAVDDDTYIFTVRAWCDSASYWDVYFDLLENCSNALAENGIDDPEERIAVRLVKED